MFLEWLIFGQILVGYVLNHVMIPAIVDLKKKKIGGVLC